MTTRTMRCLGHLLGVPVTLDVRDPLPGSTLARLSDEVLGWLRLTDELFSIACPISEVNLLDHGYLRPAEAGPVVREVLTTCARLHLRTEGYFDVHATGRLDPSEYVRGWAIQRASALLTRAGAGDHCLRVGDDVLTAGRPSPDGTWRVRIQDPHRPESVAWILSANDAAVAAAGARGGTAGQIRNPMTRRPASGLSSVTVAGPDLGVAGAYATAAVAMGPAGLDWLRGLEGHAYTAISDDGGCFHGGRLPGLLLMPSSTSAAPRPAADSQGASPAPGAPAPDLGGGSPRA
jgi:thiamine biosynthesis lipoprotein